MKGIMFNEHYGLESAVLNGSKTRTARNLVLPKNFNGIEVCGFHKYTNKQSLFFTALYDEDERDIENSEIKFKYEIGEIIAIKQSYKTIWECLDDGSYKDAFKSMYGNLKGWVNKMFVKNEIMPHQIQITDINLERLQDISNEDCLKEGIIKNSIGCYVKGIRSTKENESYTIREDGVAYRLYPNFRQAFESLIDKVSGKGTWDKNPWMVVYYFKLIK